MAGSSGCVRNPISGQEPQEIPVLVPRISRGVKEIPSNQQHMNGGEEESPVTSAKDAHPVQSPLRSSSSMESPENGDKSHGRKEGDREKDASSPRGAHRRARRSRRAENGFEHPAHKNAKNVNKVGSGSPSWERKMDGKGRQSFDSSTPGKSPRRSTNRYDQTTDQASVVPKFGDWNENDPSSGDRYTGIFDKVREEKRSGATKPPMITIDPEFYPDYGSRTSKVQGCSCFGWLRK